MAIRACGLNKRSFDYDDSIMSIIFGQIPRQFIEREFKKLITGEADLPTKKLDEKKSKGIYVDNFEMW